MFFRYCQQPDSPQSKSAPVSIFLLHQFKCRALLAVCHQCDFPIQTAEMEEVEPYASFVQRVNSLYNSSAIMFM